MKIKKFGLVLFWFAVFWGFLSGIIGSIYQTEFFLKVLTFKELSLSIWSTNGPLMSMWSASVPFAAILAGVGLLLYVGASKATIWKFGAGIVGAIILVTIVGQMGHHSWLYGVMGTLILVNFFWILWGWAKERTGLRGNAAIGADLKLAGYVFLLIGMWFTCGTVSWYWLKAFAGQPPLIDPIILMIYFVLGLTCICLGYNKSAKQ